MDAFSFHFDQQELSDVDVEIMKDYAAAWMVAKRELSEEAAGVFVVQAEREYMLALPTLAEYFGFRNYGQARYWVDRGTVFNQRSVGARRALIKALKYAIRDLAAAGKLPREDAAHALAGVEMVLDEMR